MTQLPTPFDLITRLTSWFLRRDRDITLPSGRGIFITGANVEITTGGIVITGGNITVDGTVDGVDISVHAADGDAHHNESHTVVSHSDTSATGSELNTLTDGSDASSLHDHDGRYFQQSEFSSDTGSNSAPLETDSSGYLTVVRLTTEESVLIEGSGVLVLTERGAPGTPSSTLSYLYTKTDGKLYFKNDAGTETALT